MELYFLRHAIAAEPGTIAVNHDSERPLTDEGIEKMKASSKGMRRMGLSFDDIISSPYIRALDTAEIVAKELGFKGKIKLSDTLVPSGEFKDLIKVIKDLKPESRTLFVGHMPSIGEFVSHLISGRNTISVDFKKGGICRVDIPEEWTSGVLGQLKWFLTPSQLHSFSSQ